MFANDRTSNPTNAERTDLASYVLKVSTRGRYNGRSFVLTEEVERDIQDLIANLLHYAKHLRLDIDDTLKHARAQFYHEIEQEEEQERLDVPRSAEELRGDVNIRSLDLDEAAQLLERLDRAFRLRELANEEARQRGTSKMTDGSLIVNVRYVLDNMTIGEATQLGIGIEEVEDIRKLNDAGGEQFRLWPNESVDCAIAREFAEVVKGQRIDPVIINLAKSVATELGCASLPGGAKLYTVGYLAYAGLADKQIVDTIDPEAFIEQKREETLSHAIKRVVLDETVVRESARQSRQLPHRLATLADSLQEGYRGFAERAQARELAGRDGFAVLSDGTDMYSVRCVQHLADATPNGVDLVEIKRGESISDAVKRAVEHRFQDSQGLSIDAQTLRSAHEIAVIRGFVELPDGSRMRSVEHLMLKDVWHDEDPWICQDEIDALQMLDVDVVRIHWGQSLAAGVHQTLDDARALPFVELPPSAPLQARRIGTGPQTVKIAGRIADGYVVGQAGGAYLKLDRYAFEEYPSKGDTVTVERGDDGRDVVRSGSRVQLQEIER